MADAYVNIEYITQASCVRGKRCEIIVINF